MELLAIAAGALYGLLQLVRLALDCVNQALTIERQFEDRRERRRA